MCINFKLNSHNFYIYPFNIYFTKYVPAPYGLCTDGGRNTCIGKHQICHLTSLQLRDAAATIKYQEKCSVRFLLKKVVLIFASTLPSERCVDMLSFR